MRIETLRNLTPDAADDLEKILERSLRWGTRKASETETVLISQWSPIADGESLGHRRPDIPTRLPTLFATHPPFVIAYNPDTRMVLRIIDGRRDLPKLFI